MSNQILTRQSQKVNDLNALTALAATATRIKLHDGHLRQSARFFTPQGVRPVEIETETFEHFTAWLKANGWDLRPDLANGSYTARRRRKAQPGILQQAALLALILLWLILAMSGRALLPATKAVSVFPENTPAKVVSGEVLEGRSILVNLGESVWVLEV